LLLTGTAGRIATAVRAVLRELADEVVLTDRTEPGAVAAGERFVRALRIGTRSWWELPPALGYEPVDDAEAFVDEVAPDDGSPFQGGPSTARLRRVGGAAASPAARGCTSTAGIEGCPDRRSTLVGAAKSPGDLR